MQIAIVLYPGVTALDAVGPYEMLRNIPNAEIRFVHHAIEPVVTDSGVLVLGATHTFASTPSPEIVLVPGSERDTATAMADRRLIQWLQRVHTTTMWTTSVCSGAMILAAAGILEGHPATTHWAAQKLLKNFGAIAQSDKRIVQSGKILTGAGVSAGIDLALYLVGQLCGQERAEVAQLIIEYDPQPPYHAGHPQKASKKVYELAKAEMKERAKNPKNVLSVPNIVWQRTLARVTKRSRTS